MKRFLLLLLSFILALTLLVACDKKTDKPDDTTGTEAVTQAPSVTESETEHPSEAPTELPTEDPTEMPTEAPTEIPADTASVTEETTVVPEKDETVTGEAITEENEPLTDIHDVMAAIILRNDLGKLTNYRVSTKMDLEFLVSVFGFTTKMNMTGGMSFTQASADAMSVEMEVPTQAPYSLTLVDGVLYMVSADGKFKCPLDEGEQDRAWSELVGGLFPSDDTSHATADDENILKILSALLETMDVTALFRDTNVAVDPATGMTIIILCGISPEVRETLDGWLESMEQNALQLDGENAAIESMNFLASLLKSVDMDQMTMTLTADRDMLLQDYKISAPVDMDGISDDIVGNLPQIPGVGSNVPMKTTLTLSSAIERGGQTVIPPADADTYEETDWQTLFGLFTSDMQDPDESEAISEAVG
ncbi:MAG: hypothetical protein IJW00_07580 [Clostridia bacterium]|nr:hypothetical protein [Clostridia bacterium]